MKKFAFLFPGQGAQVVGMGKDFYDQFPIAKEVFQQVDDILSFSLTSCIFNGPIEELTLTKNSQIAIFTVSYAIFKVMQSQFPTLSPSITAGLSLGEYTALVAAQKLSFVDGVSLVRKRGLYMQQSSEDHPGSMSVILGMEEDQIREHLTKHKLQGVWIANLNCPSQVVISGTKDGLEKLGLILREAGAKRVLPLTVSGAFHSGLMQDAQAMLGAELGNVPLQDSKIQIVMNTPGDFVETLDEVRQNLLKQVVEPVYWEKGIRNIEKTGVDTYIEFGPGKTLSGMNKKIKTSSPTVNITSVEDLENIAQII